MEIIIVQAALVTEPTLTDRFQTTVPSVVRKAQHFDRKDKIKFIIQPNGEVMLSQVEQKDNDPVIEYF